MTGVEPLAAGLDPHELHLVIVEERVEGADRVRPAADAGDHPTRERRLHRERLRAGLVADHSLEVSDEGRVRRRADHRADHVMRGGDVGDPVADRGADRLLQGPGARLHWGHLGAQQTHALHVRRLASHVLGAHVDHALEAEQRAGGRRGDPMLTGAGLGDHPRLAHAPGKQRLADRVVDLVGAGMREILALEVDAASDPLGEAPRQIEGRRAPDVVAEQVVELAAEAGVVPRLHPGGAELVERGHQHLGDEPSAVGAEALLDACHRAAGCPGWTGVPHCAITRGSAVAACAASKKAAMRS
jgi:hypothetical protein